MTRTGASPPPSRTDGYLLPRLDAVAFRRDVLAAAAQVGNATTEDADHLRRLVAKVRALQVVGHALLFATAIASAVDSLSYSCCVLCAVSSMVMISTGRVMAWAIVGHHTMHGGFTSLAKAGVLSEGWRRGRFAVGAWRRCCDWLDWILPEAWNLEHNKLHHYQLSEEGDPDVVERNFDSVRSMGLPVPVKLASMAVWMLSWKYTYYSTNTLKQLRLSQPDSFVARHWPRGDSSNPKSDPLVVFNFLPEVIGALLRGDAKEACFWVIFLADWLWIVAPMFFSVLAPSLLLWQSEWLCPGLWAFVLATDSTNGSAASGSADMAITAAAQNAAWFALLLSLGADAMSNFHSFVIIACNHAGDDLYRFSTPCSPNGAEFLLRCSYAGVNFETGSETVDVLYGWLNYQIEHHMFPDMTPLQYRKLQPLVKEACKKHGVLYIQENAIWRTWKTLLIATGAESMMRCTAVLPPELEAESQFGGQKKTI